MSLLSSRFCSAILLSSLLLAIPASTLASNSGEDRIVYIASLQGDVRLSRGDGKHTDLNKGWELAVPDELLEQGYALATDNGRAEITFENGSTVYLAENSLLLFAELGTPGDRTIAHLTLVTGTATFDLKPFDEGSFYIETPTDKIKLPPPQTLFARIDAYLDATAITPQGVDGESLVRPDWPELRIAKGQTLFIQAGGIIEFASFNQGVDTPEQPSVSAGLRMLELGAAPFGELGFLPLIQEDMVRPSTSSPIGTPNASPFSMATGAARSPVTSYPQLGSDWDSWVSTQVEEKSVLTAAALKASGLSSPIPGLADLYEQGSFFPCAPYGTCWEPKEVNVAQGIPAQSPTRSAQPTAAPQANTTFQPQTVEWHEQVDRWCAPPLWRTVMRVAHSSEELQRLLQIKDAVEHAPRASGRYSVVCNNGYWIRHHGHYARVVTSRTPPKCTGINCHPVHSPRPVWVRVGNKVGFVPPHPKDVKGEPPLNLKNGIIVPPSNPGQPVERLAWDPFEKVKMLGKVPSEFQGERASRMLEVSAPEIRAHLLQELLRGKPSSTLSGQQNPKITYDYKSHHFLVASARAAGAKSKELAVGGIDSHGKVASFADGRSGRYANSFARSEIASSYRGDGGWFSQGRGLGSFYSGGGHGSGYSSGSYAAGSHSSGSSSSGGSAVGGSASSASSGASSSGSSGGGSHGRP